ncbi:MAG: HAD family phosphatase [Lachnospiraceae bacterium]|jgi:HAD superfamily hydrolase (TIGR01509 family)|nr:HAD family phosphatase [Lachnospiraceae bacterium]
MGRAIIFDMDGVLFDTEAFGLKAWEAAGREYGIEGLAEASMSCIGTNAARTKEIITGIYGKNMPYDAVRAFKKKYTLDYFRAHGMPVKPGVKELLAWLRDVGWKAGLSTSTSRATVEEELEIAGLTPYFDTIVCGDELKKSKPDPLIFLLCGEKMHCEPADTPVIEDSYNGVRAAYRAGMQPVMVPDLVAPDAEMRELCRYICAGLGEVQTLLAEGKL